MITIFRSEHDKILNGKAQVAFGSFTPSQPSCRSGHVGMPPITTDLVNREPDEKGPIAAFAPSLIVSDLTDVALED